MGENQTRLKAMIENRGLTQQQLATASGLETYQISLLASGSKPNCMRDTMIKICKALRCTLDEAFGDDELDRNAL
jgi:DNA-binding Xre family transcriptional regulator